MGLDQKTCVPCRGGIPPLSRWEAEPLLNETPGWTIEAPHPFSVVCFRHDAPGTLEQSNAHNARILDRVNASGEVFLSHTILRGRYVLRVAVGNLRTERRHLERAWTLLREAGATA